jgi:RNA recognition motif-containing protein
MDIYVGNLPYEIDEKTLRSAFEEYGAVNQINVVEDRDTGRPRGFAFVTMENSDEAKAAIKALEGAEIGGRSVKVNESKPKEMRQGGGNNFRGGNRGGGGNRNRRF